MTAIVMTVAILAIYKISNMFQMQLRLSSLVFCGIFALLINFLSITVSPFLDQYRFIVLGVMIFAAAVVSTLYNSYMIRRRAKAEARGEEPVPLLTEFANHFRERQKARKAAKEAALAAAATEAEAKAAMEMAMEPEPIPVPEPVMESEPEPMSVPEQVIEPEPEVVLEPIIEPEPGPVPEQVIEPEPEVVLEQVIEPEPEVVLEPVIEPEPGPVPEPVIEPEPEPAVDVALEDDISDKLAALTNMDDLLDYAFELKGNADWGKALQAYEYALKEYPDDAYAPMLVIEICNIHKDNGHYPEAIQSFKDALSLPAIVESPDMAAEFEDSIMYLETVYSVLQEEGQDTIPFYDIPKDYMSKIESIYNNRKSR